MKLRKLDLAFAVGCAALELMALLRGPDAGWAGIALMLAACATLLGRRRAPELVLAATAAATIGVSALGGEPIGSPVAVATYSLGAFGLERRYAIAIYCAAGLALFVADFDNAILVSGFLFFGLAMGEQRRTRAERDEIAARATERERTAIARELHDVLAHSVSVMLVGVRGARDVIATEPQVAYETLGRVEASAERSLAELRRSLHVLRDANGSAALAPQPSLRDLEALLADAGLPVQLHVSGERRVLHGGLELSAYRLVQEALTNVRKHADASRADVYLDFGEDTLGVTILDDGAGDRGGEGRGLVGMGERVAMLGGKLETGSRPTGGYRVRATLPIA